jgi:hypothetical protein
MTAVLVLADIPSAGVIREVQADRLTLPASATSAESLACVDHMAHGLREREAVIALYPAWRPGAAVHLVRLARGMLRTDRIAGIPLELPPLAFSLVADQLAYLSAYVKPGVLASLAHRLSQEILAGAWVNSVARLEKIRTGIGEHVSSYLPGTGFMVSAAPRADVHRITTAQPVAPIAHRPADPVLVLATQENGDVEWLQGKFRFALGAQSVTFVGGQPLSSEFWGARKYVEFVAFSGHQYALQNVLRATPCRPCPWCAEQTALEVCPFCSMVQPGPPQAERPEGPETPEQPGQPASAEASWPVASPAAAPTVDRSPQGAPPPQVIHPAAVYPPAHRPVPVRPPPRPDDVPFPVRTGPVAGQTPD